MLFKKIHSSIFKPQALNIKFEKNMYNKGLFNDWVPKPVQLLMIALLVIVVLPMGGVYTGNISFMVGGTGELSEYFMFANYATTIGMGASMPIVLRMKMRFKVRNKFVFLLVLLGLLGLVNATTLNPVVIVGVSLMIGFLKMMVAIELFLPLMMMMGDRGVFYGVFYTAVLSLNQISSYYAVEVSILYNWQQFFVIVTIMCFVMALLCWVLMHDKYFALKVPLHYIDWMSIILFISAFMFLAYVLSFGKQQDWLNSKRIIHAAIASFISFGLLVVRQFTLKRPYLSFSIFTKNNVLNGLFMLFWMGMFLGTASIQNIFSVGVLGYDQLTNAKLNLFMIPGLITAGIAAVYWFKKKKPLKMFIFSGFSAMLGYALIMYFSMVPEFNYENWYLPMFLKGYGMAALFIAVWFYTLDKLELNDMLAAIGLVLVWRTFLTVGIFSALFSWFQYQFQIESLGNLAVYMDGMTISPQNVAGNMKMIQLNAILAANKRIFGYVVIVGFMVLVYVLTHHFGVKRFHYLRFIRVLSGKSIIAGRRIKERRIEEEIKDAAGYAM
ncbi:MFS transporter [Chryseobacterium daeguense]|uniref:MFS transporter n=1 Tax=Chryseobacterium daeguense TaxID=412438 RepID=UPI001E40E1D3|nr:MFS transporter [Chryseobacterium daeguense]